MAGEKRLKWYDRMQVDLTDMTTEQGYHITRTSNIFDRLLGDGIASGLEVTDDSQVVFQNTQNAFDDSHLDTLGNQIIQIFLCTADNLQSVVARMRNIGAAGNVLASIYTLATPSDPTSAISATAIAQSVVSAGSIGATFGEVTFDFSAQSAVSDAEKLTVGDYYAVAFQRDSIVGSIDISYATNNPYGSGYIRYYDFTSDAYTNQLTQDLYIKIFTDAVQIAIGYAYKNGDPIEVESIQRKINLADTSGATNYIVIKYKETLTDQELNPRLGTPEYSRIQDDFEVVVRTTLASIASDEEILATTAHTGVFPLVISDQRVFIPGRNSLWDNYVNKNVLLTGETVQAGLSIKDCVYYNTTNSQWEKASNVNPPQGVLTSSGVVTNFGQATGLSGLTAGAWYYMDSSGNLTTVNTDIKVGYAYSSTILLIDIDFGGGAGYDITISSQAGFEAYFGDGTETGTGTTAGGWAYSESGGNVTVTVPRDTSIFIKSNPPDGVTTHYKYDATNFNVRAYELKTKVNMQTAEKILGEGIDQSIVIKGNDFAEFSTAYESQEAVTGVSSNDFTVADSSAFREGQTIEHSNDNKFYKIISVPDGTSILVDRDISGVAAGNISICQDSIELKDFTFDGRGNVDGLGGSRTGRAFDLNYCAHSNFELKTINFKITGNGGAYDGNDLVFRLKIGNIFYCEASGNGGAVLKCDYSEIYEIHNCHAAGSGAVYLCDYAHIHHLYDCYASNPSGASFGGAVRACNYSEIHDMNRCGVDATYSGSHRGGVCYDCNNCNIYNLYDCYMTATNTFNNIQGGICAECDNCEISNVHNCYAHSTIGNILGGVFLLCNNCKISNIYSCYANATANTRYVYGGVCYDCNNCEISNIYSCYASVSLADAQGGVCWGCDNCKISNINNCYVSSAGGNAYGGVCYQCTYCKISSIDTCYAVTTNSGSDAQGGCCYDCDHCNVSSIDGCYVTSTTGNAYGGACSGCDYSNMSSIFNCSATSTTGATAGGGCYNCDDCSISDIHDCTAENDDNDGAGGGCADCGTVTNKCMYLGAWTGNTCDGAAGSGHYNTVDNGYGFGHFYHDSTYTFGSDAGSGNEGAINID
jgi:hypothetical protein